MGTIQIKRGTAAALTTANQTLAAGEPCFESDTAKLKIGDGVTAWTSLAYFGVATKIDDFAAADDNTDLNATTSAHGLCPKGDATATHFLNGNLGWTEPTIASIDGGVVT